MFLAVLINRGLVRNRKPYRDVLSPIETMRSIDNNEEYYARIY